MTDPKEPSAAEIAQHMLTHLPYKCWCKYCVAGRRPNAQHRRQTNERSVPMLSCDYGFFRDPGGVLLTFLVVHLQPYGVYFAAVVDAKGRSKEVIDYLASVIQECGLVHFVYRSDREKAIRALLDEAIRLSGRHGTPIEDDTQPGDHGSDIDNSPQAVPTTASPDLAVPEHSHTGESQSNRTAERSVQMVEDLVRTLKAALEDRMGQQIPCDSPLMHWIFRHAVFLLTKYHVGPDHLTGYMRLHGKASHFDRIAELGESIMWYVPKRRRTKLEPKWRSGVFLGRMWNTDANYVGLADGTITTARALVRVPESQRWDTAKLLAMSGTPLSMRTVNFDRLEEAEDPHRGPAGHRHDGPEDEAQQRRVPIQLRDLVTHGYTDGCSRCQAHSKGEHNKARSLNHSEQCRARMYRLMRAARDPRILAADAEGGNRARARADGA